MILSKWGRKTGGGCQPLVTSLEDPMVDSWDGVSLFSIVDRCATCLLPSNKGIRSLYTGCARLVRATAFMRGAL